MTLAPRKLRRPGLSLMEVLVALTVFLIALIGLGKLAIIGSDRALETQDQIRAAQLCQSKMAELLVGAVSLNGQTDVPFDEDPDWTWSLEADQGNVSGLWNVTLRVKHESAAGLKVECVMSQMILDPSLRGSTMDAALAAAANSSSSTSSTDSGSQNNNNQSQQQQNQQGQKSQPQQNQVKGGVTAPQSNKQQTSTPARQTTPTNTNNNKTNTNTNNNKTNTNTNNNKTNTNTNNNNKTTRPQGP
jgi:Tfp pilus assembly protein PilV